MKDARLKRENAEQRILNIITDSPVFYQYDLAIAIVSLSNTLSLKYLRLSL